MGCLTLVFLPSFLVKHGHSVFRTCPLLPSWLRALQEKKRGGGGRWKVGKLPQHFRLQQKIRMQMEKEGKPPTNAKGALPDERQTSDYWPHLSLWPKTASDMNEWCSTCQKQLKIINEGTWGMKFVGMMRNWSLCLIQVEPWIYGGGSTRSSARQSDCGNFLWKKSFPC